MACRYTVKKLSIFPSPAGISLKLFPAMQGEFGK
jgi:hypothetical protein